MVFLKETLQKKLSESWFYKNNCKNISKYYKRILIALLILCLLILLAFVIYYYFLSDKYKTKPIEIPKFNHTVPNLNQNHQLIIELLIAVDGTMKDFHKENLNTYILQLTSTASKVFSDASIGGYTILISVTNIIVLNKFRKISNGTAYDGGLLNDFCRVVAKSNYHYDAAMFISRDRICSGSCKAIGLARMRSICTYGACALVQDNGLQTAITIAHELGHILGMPHDNDERCKNVIKACAHKSIMHTQMTYDMDPWTWSDCSRHYLYDLLEHEDGSCLEHTSIQSIGHYSNTRLAGEIYNLDQQCKLAYGSPQRHCNIQSECKRLWCMNPNNKNNSTCHSNNFPWADGTPCKTKNNSNSYWCLKGECVPRVGYAPKIVNGGWSPWSAWSECSLSCGGGIQTTLRECNNPVAKNGGKYCMGVGKKYRSCNTQNCPIGSRDPLEEQCSKKNGINLNISITGYGPHTKWVPMYTAPHKNKCVLHCHAQGTLIFFSNIFHDKLIDGTPCSLNNFDKCVNGVCRPAGCDNQLNSIAKIDKCGVCEGHNKTCVDIAGYFKVLDLYKTQPIYGNVYYPVTTIPKGASSIVIEQVAFPEDNYIVLKDDQGNWLLNGNLTVIPFDEIKAYAGVLYDYNGSRSSVERVNTTYGRTLKKDLNVEILSYSSYKNRDKNANLMRYSYSIDKNKLNRLKKS